LDCRVRRFQPVGSKQLGNCLLRLPQLKQHHCQGLVPLGNLRLQANNFRKARPRFFQLACLPRRIPRSERGIRPLDGILGWRLGSLGLHVPAHRKTQ
jgi:hypothetical protein